ncbi:MAG: hypothetical protein ACFFG0_28320 [Candidatus Thorarchaeota archaeon]
MRNLSEQFYGEMRLANWITKKYSSENIRKLINKFPYDKKRQPIELDFWTMGPKKDKTGIWLYGQSDNKDYYSFDMIVESITVLDYNNLIVHDWKKTPFLLKKDRSASSLARKLDYFLHGAYTDIPPMHMDELFDCVCE